MKKERRRSAGKLLIMLALMTLMLALGGQAWAQSEYRALIIGNGAYNRLNSLGAGPKNDSMAMEAALQDKRLAQPVQVTRRNDLTLAAMRGALKTAFAGADEDDVSLFFYSGHGALMQGDAYLCPIDAAAAPGSMLSMGELRRILDAVPGQKIVILDSCYSGAAIARGAASPAQRFGSRVLQAFSGPQARTTMAKGGYKVLTASGAREQSYVTNWPADGGAVRLSCFSGALSQSLGAKISGANGFSASPGGAIAADINGDNQVSLSELYEQISARMRELDGQSNVQVYPRSDSTPLFCYGAGAAGKNPVEWQRAKHSAVRQGQAVDMQARLKSPVNSLKLLVYRRQYAGGPLREVQSLALGAQSAGELSVRWDGRNAAGERCEPGVYFMKLIGTDAAGRAFEAQCAMAQVSLTAVQQSPRAGIRLPESAMAVDGQNEIAIEVQNPGQEYLAQRYTIVIRDEAGQRRRVLAQNQLASRSFEDEGDGLTRLRFVDRFYWDGRDDQGRLLSPGRYQIELTAAYMGQKLTRSAQMTLLSPEKAAITDLGASAALLRLNHPGAHIRFYGSTNAPGLLQMEVYNAQGARVSRLLQGYHPGGAFSAGWDGANLSGASVKSGRYTLRVRLNGRDEARFSFKVSAGAAAPALSQLRVGAAYQGGSLKCSLRLNRRGRVRAWICTEAGEEILQLPSAMVGPGRVSRSWKQALPTGRYLLRVQTQNPQSGRTGAFQQVKFEVRPQPAPALSRVRTSGRYACKGGYTYFRFQANRAGRYTITLYDDQGRALGRLRTQKACTRGNHGIRLYLKKDGRRLPRGRYALGIRLESGGAASPEQRVMIRVK
jgi:flagellar hook assembly protein FlgD